MGGGGERVWLRKETEEGLLYGKILLINEFLEYTDQTVDNNICHVCIFNCIFLCLFLIAFDLLALYYCY